MQSRAQTAWDVIAWDVIGTVLFRVLVFGGFYAFASWCCMVFLGHRGRARGNHPHRL